MCLWAHRSLCCLAASVGIYCLPLQFCKKFSKLLHALTLTFQSTNTTSYLPGKAEIRTSNTYKKTWTEKEFSSIQPQTTATNHIALVLWTPQKNSKALLCLKVPFPIHQISTQWRKPWQSSIPLNLCFGSSIKLGQNYRARWAAHQHYQAQRAMRCWCFSSRNDTGSQRNSNWWLNPRLASPPRAQHTAWGAVTATPSATLRAPSSRGYKTHLIWS